jgi:hypothetical protein
MRSELSPERVVLELQSHREEMPKASTAPSILSKPPTHLTIVGPSWPFFGLVTPPAGVASSTRTSPATPTTLMTPYRLPPRWMPSTSCAAEHLPNASFLQPQPDPTDAVVPAHPSRRADGHRMPRLTVTPFGRNAPPLAAANGEPPPPLVTKMGFMPFELAIVPVAHMSVLPFTEIRLPATTPTTMSALPYFQFELLSPAEFGPTSCGPK